MTNISQIYQSQGSVEGGKSQFVRQWVRPSQAKLLFHQQINRLRSIRIKRNRNVFARKSVLGVSNKHASFPYAFISHQPTFYFGWLHCVFALSNFQIQTM